MSWKIFQIIYIHYFLHAHSLKLIAYIILFDTV